MTVRFVILVRVQPQDRARCQFLNTLGVINVSLDIFGAPGPQDVSST